MAACDNRDQKASFSNFGNSIDVSAPGVNIDSSTPGGGFGVKSGTSMAAPHVSAAVALLKSDARHTDLGPGEITALLHTLVDDVGSLGFDIFFGHGVVNLARLDMTEALPNDSNPVTSQPDTSGNTATYDFKAEELTLNGLLLLTSTVYDFASAWGTEVTIDENNSDRYITRTLPPDIILSTQNLDHEYVTSASTNRNGDVGPRGITIGETTLERTLELLAIEAVADKGYESREDIENCLMNGTVPNVALKYDKTERIFNLAYEEAEITDERHTARALYLIPNPQRLPNDHFGTIQTRLFFCVLTSANRC